MSQDNTDDRRRAHRAEVLLQVSYTDPEELKNDYITNFSQGGVFIHTSISFERGEELSFTLSFPGLLKPIALRGVVRWQSTADAGDPARPRGIGVEFIIADEAQRQQIQGLLQTLDDPIAQVTEPQRAFRVLMVEDNAFAMELFDYAVRRFWKGSVGARPLEVVHAPDAHHGLRELYHNPVDLAIIDHFMAGVTGCELVQMMRAEQRTRKTPIIVVSVGGEEIREMAYECGADMFLDKPVMHKQLVGTVAKLLSDQRSARGRFAPECQRSHG